MWRPFLCISYLTILIYLNKKVRVRVHASESQFCGAKIIWFANASNYWDLHFRWMRREPLYCGFVLVSIDADAFSYCHRLPFVDRSLQIPAFVLLLARVRAPLRSRLDETQCRLDVFTNYLRFWLKRTRQLFELIPRVQEANSLKGRGRDFAYNARINVLAWN